MLVDGLQASESFLTYQAYCRHLLSQDVPLVGLYSGQHTEEELGHCQLPQQVVRICLVTIPYSNNQTIIKEHQTCTHVQSSLHSVNESLM